MLFFVELIQQLDFELLEIDEQQPAFIKDAIQESNENDTEEDDPFLDWEAELRNAKKKK